MKALSLFSGIGGIDLAAEWAGIETVAFCEREPFCQKVLKKHWPNVPIYDDVCTLTKARLEADGIGTIDLIHGGYPCQGESLAGQRKGAEDDRWLWPECFRLIQEIRPRWVVCENVAGHITMGLDNVLDDLGGAEYTAQAFVIPAAAIGASHKRDRVFIVAFSSFGECESRSEVERILRALHENGTKHGDADGGGETMANTPEQGLSQRRRTGLTESTEEAGAGQVKRSERFSETMGNSNIIHLQRQQSLWIGTLGRRDSAWEYQRPSDGAGQQRAAQSQMGGVLDELSTRLDGGVNPLNALIDFIRTYPQPALMGMPQFDWEPPRVATGVKNRAARLKGLGNAVNPLQILPIMAAIKWIDDRLRSDRIT